MDNDKPTGAEPMFSRNALPAEVWVLEYEDKETRIIELFSTKEKAEQAAKVFGLEGGCNVSRKAVDDAVGKDLRLVFTVVIGPDGKNKCDWERDELVLPGQAPVAFRHADGGYSAGSFHSAEGAYKRAKLAWDEEQKLKRPKRSKGGSGAAGKR